MTHGSIQNARVKYEEKDINSYLSSILSISFISFSILLIISLFFNKWLSLLLGIQKDLVILIVLQSFFSYFMYHNL